ncbi:hypothetical protein Vadar_019472 [Vaccinium darrowii]|uniref:Uncharacterized protein n=1 Tax=Vaccinium darrowii TaxID=229202 RepID=A0ACB7YFN6_9ERIC|nr:hypothetical protein Vadar_019472 [Vaccinium darrowii]
MEEDEKVVKSFKDLGLHDELLEAYDKSRLETAVQDTGKDLIGLAQTGSGKTGAFALPIIQALLETPQSFFACVLSPTLELAIQIVEQFEALGSGIGLKCGEIRFNIYVSHLVGGVDHVQLSIALAKRPHIVCLVEIFAANTLLIWPFKWDGNSTNLIAEGVGMAHMLVGYYRCWLLPLPIFCLLAMLQPSIVLSLTTPLTYWWFSYFAKASPKGYVEAEICWVLRSIPNKEDGSGSGIKETGGKKKRRGGDEGEEEVERYSKGKALKKSKKK